MSESWIIYGGNSFASIFGFIHTKRFPSVILFGPSSCGLDNDFMRMLIGREMYDDEAVAIQALKNKLKPKS